MEHVNKKHLGIDNATVNQQELIRILPQTPIRLAEQISYITWNQNFFMTTISVISPKWKRSLFDS